MPITSRIALHDMERTSKFGLTFLITFFLVFIFPTFALAQNLGFADYLEIENESSIPSGTVIVHKNGNYAVANEAYSKDTFGVVTNTPAVELKPVAEISDAYPVVKNGVVTVRVNGESGSISNGDLITTSSTPGEAMKAVSSGFTLGVAQADFSPDSPADTGLIPILIDIKFSFSDDAPNSQRIVSRLMSVVSLSTLSIVEEPIKSLRYIVAGLVILISLLVGFVSFGRVAYKGVEALGRNPLAKNSILTGVIINTLLGLSLAALGLATAYVIVTW